MQFGIGNLTDFNVGDWEKVRSGNDRLEGQQWCRKSAATVFFFLLSSCFPFYKCVYTNSR